MALPVGQISFSEVNVELTRPATQELSIDDVDVRSIAGVGGPNTVISMNDLRGKSGRIAISLVISANTNNYDVFTNRSPLYVAGKSDITLTIQSSATVGSTTLPTSALNVPSSFDADDTVTIINQGTILGAGGTGGPFSTNGTAGGSAVNVARTTTIDNQGVIAGGGGGGGGGQPGVGVTPRPPKSGGPFPSPRGGGGGGGGAGVLGGVGGTGGPGSFVGGTGGTGTSATGGAGGPAAAPATPGGPGGGRGAAGSNAPVSPSPRTGGAAGSYIVGNPFVTWANNGTRLGNVS